MANAVAKRREARMAGIVACAWTLAKEHGIGGVSLHALAREVGMRQPSLYEYFDSKNALYDAMFADGNRQLMEQLDAVTFSREPRAALKQWLAAFATFACEDTARSQLLFQRPIPGFTPSPESYALAEEVLGGLDTLMRATGVTEQGDIDCIVAVTAGLTDAQISNDPGGNRWLRHLNRLVDLLVDDALARGATNDR
ncbi:MAG: TetR/AcrR family transcriptional regulator [Trebonia sp.]|jgi:AcrR family transcriptional regulator|uniref:TetR/AcrR family transcriptional regulator n=1 Tax=Trebonia sp. TaxID=2767075 RepID=UPI003BAF3EEC